MNETSPSRVILITGANGDLGCAIARYFLETEKNAFLYLSVHCSREKVDTLCEAHPDRCAALSLDVTQPESWQEATAQILERKGRIDVLVNNAGGHADNLLGQLSDEEWHGVIDRNLHSAFYGMRSVIKAMMAQREGRIVNIASLSALLAPRGQSNYAAAKAGVVALTRSTAKEVARFGITVNALCPGYIESAALEALDRKQILAQIPMRRVGTPEEVAATVYFLTCAAAGYITGSVIKIDGGIF